MGAHCNVEDHTDVLTNWKLVLHPDMVLRAQGADPGKIRGRQPKLVSLAQRAIADGMARIQPRAALRTYKVVEKSDEFLMLENRTELRSTGVVRKLSGAELIVVAVATLGEGLEREIEKMHDRDVLYQLALDGFGTAALDQMTAKIKETIQSMATWTGLQVTNPLHPGTADWELGAGQTQIFSLVDANAVGVSLNASSMMTPRKSVSMLYGIGKNVRRGRSACAECDVSERCRHKPSLEAHHAKR